MNQEEKWNKHFQQSETEAIAANEVLQQYTHLLPESGKALDFACGLGGNAMLLANSGLDTYAWDISTIALDKLETLAKKSRLNLTTEARDIELRPPEPNCFDVIVVGKFLYRPGFRALIHSLRDQGLIFYQTFTETKISQGGPSNPDYLLRRNELLALCDGMNILVYREEDKVGDVCQGWRNQAMIIAQK